MKTIYLDLLLHRKLKKKIPVFGLMLEISNGNYRRSPLSVDSPLHDYKPEYINR